MLQMSEITSGMQVRHMESGEAFFVAGVPFWFDGDPAVTLRDRKGNVRISRLSGLVAVNKNSEDESK